MNAADWGCETSWCDDGDDWGVTSDEHVWVIYPFCLNYFCGISSKASSKHSKRNMVKISSETFAGMI